jgi:hypothetical protein
MTRARISVLVLLAILALGGAALATGASAGGVATTNAVKSLSGCGTTELARNDDRSSATVPLGFTINFFGTNYTSLYVNNNGNVTFDAALASYTPFDLTSTTRVIVAPFFADVDTNGAASGVTSYGSTTFGGRPAFCVNWPHVGYYAGRTDKLNSFQLLIVNRSDIGPGDVDIIFNYDQIQWETGSATSSGGVDGLGGHSARAGYSNGSTTSFELPGSAVNGAFLDSSPGGLANNSRASLERGRYVFPVRSGVAPVGGFVSGHVVGETEDGLQVSLAGAPVQICRQDVVPAICSTTTTDANGAYIVAGLTAGTYNGIAVPPAARPDLFPDINALVNLGNNQGLIDYDFKLVRPRPRPPGVTIDSIATTSTGAPVLNWSSPVQVTTMNASCQGGSASYELILEGAVIASGPMPATATAGLFKGTIPPLRPQHGPALLVIEVSCPGAGVDKTVEVDVYIDPSGYVRTVQGAPIAGATVTLYRSDTSAGPFEVVPNGSASMEPSNRNNPDLTNAEGFFHWDVLAGYYKVRAEKAGCTNPANAAQPYVETGVLEIPPPAVNLELVLDCGGAPVNTPTRTPTGGGPTRTPTPRPSADAGDVNKNGRVDSIDASIVLQYTAGFLDTINDTADANDDGLVTSVDATLILQFGAGLIHDLPV